MAPVLLHTGVASLEASEAPYPEYCRMSAASAQRVNETRRDGGTVVAVGTTVVRALESAMDAGRVRPARGFTRVYIGPMRPVRSVDGILTGFHDARSTHLSMLAALVGVTRLRRAYDVAAREGYLWHEFGDSHLIFSDPVT